MRAFVSLLLHEVTIESLEVLSPFIWPMRCVSGICLLITTPFCSSSLIRLSTCIDDNVVGLTNHEIATWSIRTMTRGEVPTPMHNNEGTCSRDQSRVDVSALPTGKTSYILRLEAPAKYPGMRLHALSRGSFPSIFSKSPRSSLKEGGAICTQPAKGMELNAGSSDL
ncbi:hypothetical protein NA56DRAFT_703617 [Hyaloscypha hepaticicola]|uniref:Uncharacterized protein n=1 Tax=Hyaloscypha hepaticicola TaxID=2082293 RepID=A0A2J6Q593_9HELO|nr:hypothetical protein NA56DRAFT_703617 [Hyaloscypha hepaticicola]